MNWPIAAEVEKARDDYYTQGNTDLAGTWLGVFATLLRSMEQAGTPLTDALVEQQERSLPKAYNDLIDHARTLERILAVAHHQAYKDAALIAELEQRLVSIREQTIEECAAGAERMHDDVYHYGSKELDGYDLARRFRSLKEKKHD